MPTDLDAVAESLEVLAWMISPVIAGYLTWRALRRRTARKSHQIAARASRELSRFALVFSAAPLMVLVFWLIFGISFPLGAFFTQLITEVREDGVYIRFIPFHGSFRRIGFDQVAQFEARMYRPIMEYGGWGIRCGFGKSGKAYNVKGNKGLQLVFKNDKRLLIGSQKPERLLEAMNSIRQKSE